VIHEAKPKNKAKANGSSSGNGGARKADQGKGDRIWDIPKSKEVKKLEGLVEKLGAVRDGKKVKRGDEIPDCFCQGTCQFLSWRLPWVPVREGCKFSWPAVQVNTDANISSSSQIVTIYSSLPALWADPLQPSTT
jgi:hypothetical protein